MEREIEAQRQVFLAAIEIGVEQLRQRVRDAKDDEIANVYRALRIAPGKLTITVVMPTGKDLL